MKKLIPVTLIMLMMLPLFVSAQSRSLNRFHREFKRYSEVNYISIHGSVVKLAAWLVDISGEEDEWEIEQARRLARGLKRVQIMEIEDWQEIMDRRDIELLKDDLNSEDYEILMTVREDDEDIQVFSRSGEGPELRDVILIVEDGSDLHIINLDGKFDMELIATMISEGDLY